MTQVDGAQLETRADAHMGYMEGDGLRIIKDAMQVQAARDQYPADFPALPSVPAGRYVDPQFAALEHTHLWLKSWLFVGLANDLREPGSYSLIEKLGRSVILSRGKDDVIRAFNNTCRHRGAALLTEPQGKAMRFVCPYHAWGYSLEGKLVSVPDAQDFACLNKAESGLIGVRCETWRGFVFINFDPDAPPVADHLAPMAQQTAGFPIEQMVVKGRLTVDMACNWKVAYHNFLEIYHVATVHAQSIAPFLDAGSFVVSLFQNGHSRFATKKRRGDALFTSDSFTRSSTTQTFNEFTIALPTFPNTFFAMDPSGFTLQTFWPNGPDSSIMEAYLLGWPSEEQSDKDYWASMHGIVQGILAEDLRLFASIQHSLESGILPAITMGYQERALYWFEEEVDRKIGVDRIPKSLRMTPVLAGQALPAPAPAQV